MCASCRDHKALASEWRHSRRALYCCPLTSSILPCSARVKAMFATSSNPSHATACCKEAMGLSGRFAADAATRSTYMVSAGSALMISESCRASVEPLERTTRMATSGNIGTASSSLAKTCSRNPWTISQLSIPCGELIDPSGETVDGLFEGSCIAPYSGRRAADLRYTVEPNKCVISVCHERRRKFLRNVSAETCGSPELEPIAQRREPFRHVRA